MKVAAYLDHLGRLKGVEPRARRREVVEALAVTNTTAVAPENPVADFTKATFGWGVLAFALGTAGIRSYQAIRDRMPAKPVAGARRRRR
jgi:hypothetical protein